MKKLLAAAAAGCLILLVCGWYFLFGGIRLEITAEAGNSVSLADFSRHGGAFLKAASGLDAVDTAVPGTYPVKLRCLWREFDCRVVVVDTVAPTGQVRDLTAFYTQLPEPGDFLVGAADATQVRVSFDTPPDASIEGAQTVSVCLTDLGGNVTTLQAKLTLLFDETPPQISGATDRQVYLGTVLDLAEGVSVSDDLDESAALFIDDSAVNWHSAGVYPVVYQAEDACHNVTEVTVFVTVIEDLTAPQIMGVTELSMYIGSTISYRKGIILTDDTDPAPKLTVDSSAVDLSRPGTYQVVYTATDCVGNSFSQTTTVTVREAPRSFVEEDVILQEADRLLEKILKEGMTPREQVEAIYKYLDRECCYVNSSDKSDWMQAAYKLMKTQRGDCFSFYSLSRLFFERLGLPNLTVRRQENAWRSSNHWWNMVSLDGGESWYHYDSTPHSAGLMETCLVTDADLERFNRSARGYYDWDRASYPATPER